MAHVALARQFKVALKGIVLTCVAPGSEERLNDWAPPDLIQALTDVPVLGIVPYLARIDDLTQLAAVASNLDWERLLL